MIASWISHALWEANWEVERERRLKRVEDFKNFEFVRDNVLKLKLHMDKLGVPHEGRKIKLPYSLFKRGIDVRKDGFVCELFGFMVYRDKEVLTMEERMKRVEEHLKL